MFLLNSWIRTVHRWRTNSTSTLKNAVLILRIVFVPDTEIVKNLFMMGLSNNEAKPSELEEKDLILSNINPLSKDYLIGVKLKDFFLSGFENNKKYVFLADVAVCLVTKYPLLEFHRKILLLLCSKSYSYTSLLIDVERIKN